MAWCNWLKDGRRKGRRPQLEPVIGSGLKTDMDALTSCQPGSHRGSLRSSVRPACLSSPGQKNKHRAQKCFFLAYTSVPGHTAQKPTSKWTGGKRPLWGLTVTQQGKKEKRGVGERRELTRAEVSEIIQISPALFNLKIQAFSWNTPNVLYVCNESNATKTEMK